MISIQIEPADNGVLKFLIDDNVNGGGEEFTNGVNKSSGITIIEITNETPSTFYYYCDVHSGMGADITIN